MPMPLPGAVMLGLALLASAWATQAACPPEGEDPASLQALEARGFELADDARRQRLALALVDCLGDPDPALRDGVAFEAEAAWLRADAIDLATRRRMLERLLGAIDPAQADAAGFRQPFAALVLAEVARTDRIAAWMRPDERTALVDAAAGYLSTVRDYRGFDPREGWRHGVAHGADLVMQLAMNPALDQAALDRLLTAIAAQVAPAGEHSYIDGEPARLARPMLLIAQRGLHPPEAWQRWLTRLTEPAPMASWDDAYRSRAGLAKRHNLSAFLLAAYAGARESGDARIEAVVPALREALARLR